MTSKIQPYDKVQNCLCNLPIGIWLKIILIDYTRNYVVTVVLFAAMA